MEPANFLIIAQFLQNLFLVKKIAIMSDECSVQNLSLSYLIALCNFQRDLFNLSGMFSVNYVYILEFVVFSKFQFRTADRFTYFRN